MALASSPRTAFCRAPERREAGPHGLAHACYDLDLWRIRSDVRPYLNSNDFDQIHKLRLGEYWALAILCTKKEPTNPVNDRQLKAGGL